MTTTPSRASSASRALLSNVDNYCCNLIAVVDRTLFPGHGGIWSCFARCLLPSFDATVPITLVWDIFPDKDRPGSVVYTYTYDSYLYVMCIHI